MKPAISVTRLGKLYRLSGPPTEHHRSLRDLISHRIASMSRRRPVQDIQPRKDREFWALRDLSFEIGMGERVGIIGRNGAGKSTLLKLLSRITSPTLGRIILRGRVASLLEVGTGFHPELSGRENIYVNGSILGMRKGEIKRKFDEIVDFADIERFLDTPVKRYSSGMYMRLAFAVAAHLDPEILLVDEVLAVGDANFQAKCLGKMESISNQGRTVLFVSHNMSAVATLCKRAILLQKDCEALDGTVDSIIAKYLETAPTAEAISNRTDRIGSGYVRAVGMSFQDANGMPTRALISNAPAKVVVDVEVQPEALGKPITVILVICDRSDTRLFSLYSEWQRTELKVTEPKAQLVCSVPDGFPLIPDNYSVILGVLINGVVADKLNNAAQFEIISNDAFGTGVVPSIGLGAMVVKNSWSTSQ